MIEIEQYRGREQTYVKHLFLELYLNRVARVTLHGGWNEFVYIDGFSGPWKASGDRYQDTSVYIALSNLTKIKHELAEATTRPITFRAVFVENNAASFEKMIDVTSQFSEITSERLRGDFHELALECSSKIGRAFSLVFVDPTSWAIDIARLGPVLANRGEVLINFMYSFLIRNIDNPANEEMIARMFNDPDWRAALDLAKSRMKEEDAILSVFLEGVRRVSGHKHVTATRIKWPLAERTYFYIVYATNHWRGLDEFRQVEGSALATQELVRTGLREKARSDRTGMTDLFGADVPELGSADLQERKERFSREAQRRFSGLLEKRRTVKGQEVFEALLELPFVTRTAINQLVHAERQRGTVRVSLAGNQRAIKPDTVIEHQS